MELPCSKNISVVLALIFLLAATEVGPVVVVMAKTVPCLYPNMKYDGGCGMYDEAACSSSCVRDIPCRRGGYCTILGCMCDCDCRMPDITTFLRLA